MENSVKTAEELNKKIWKALEEVPDPEIPVISVVDLGIISKVEVLEDEKIRVVMTPTFSGCPAIEYMRKNIETKIQEKLPEHPVEVKVDYETPWSSNMITDKGREALKSFRLAPPPKFEDDLDVGNTVGKASCPHCGSAKTTMNSPFGPTLCRSLHFCFDCQQSFEQFKPV